MSPVASSFQGVTPCRTDRTRYPSIEGGVLLIDTHLACEALSTTLSDRQPSIQGFELGVLLVDVSWKIIAGELEYAL